MSSNTALIKLLSDSLQFEMSYFVFYILKTDNMM